MHFIIYRHSADETDSLCIAQIVIKLGKGTWSGEDIRLECSSAAVSIVPIAVCCGVIDAAVCIEPVGRLGRIVECRIGHHATVGVVLIRIHSLGIDVKRKMLVEEIRRKAQVQSSPIVSGSIQCSFLSEISDRSSIRHPVTHLSTDAHIVFRRKCSPEDKVLPVCKIFAGQFLHSVTRGSARRIYLGIKRHQL